MKTRFICSDGCEIKTADCINKCRLNSRCAPVGYLKWSAQQRPADRKPSVTELLNGTRQAFLMRIHEYAEKPEADVFRIVGTKAHTMVEDMPNQLEFNGIVGTPDEVDDDILNDYKVIGSFKAAQVLGITYEEVATGEYYKNGKPKNKKVFMMGEPDHWEYAMQLNMYKILLEANGKKINEMNLCIIVRDGNTYTAKGRGVQQSLYYIPVQPMKQQDVLQYFMAKKQALDEALQAKVLPPICTPQECWNGRRCSEYCPVNKWCTDNPYLLEGGIEDGR